MAAGPFASPYQWPQTGLEQPLPEEPATLVGPSSLTYQLEAQRWHEVELKQYALSMVTKPEDLGLPTGVYLQIQQAPPVKR
ncbi:hypothetical protein E4U39_006688 [Claviceps sp. Clav50 group G5]|nr:hypothetical protein E4U39_006688 [Claviceps sp. Clav50 group G5]